jgi:predicted  nucleic acid-binding Zn-ribbon protein
MRTSTEIKAEINKSKAMNSCGLNYKAWATSDYMKALESELKAAEESEATVAEDTGLTDEELSNLIENIADLSDRLSNAKRDAEKLLGTMVDSIVLDDLICDEDDYECATLDDIKYDIDIDLE